MRAIMTKDSQILQAISTLKIGGIIAYPTEAVYGLGCDPYNQQAVTNLLQLKQRDTDKGLILLLNNWEQVWQLTTIIENTLQQRLRDTWPGAITWLLPANKQVPIWIKGEHNTVAIRMTAHPLAKQLCQQWGKPLVSSSANIAQRQPTTSVAELKQQFPTGIDYILEGSLGDLTKPTEIRDLLTGKIIRK